MKAFLKAIIYQPLFNLLIFLVWLMPNHNLGLAVIVLTIIIRLIFLPSGLKQGVSAEKMRLLQPKIKKIQEKYKDDKTAQSQAMMSLYKQAGTSPWGACLPMLVQIVVLILLYRVFQIGFSTSRFDLLYKFIPRPDSINTTFLGINLSKPDPWVLPIATGIIQFFQSKLTMPPKQKGGDDNPMMAATGQMMYLFPIMTIFIARNLPAALPIYWMTSSAFMVVQQIYINKVLKPRVNAHLEQLPDLHDLGSVPQISEAKVTSTENILEKKETKGVTVSIRKKVK